jgi:hypothetical protein
MPDLGIRDRKGKNMHAPYLAKTGSVPMNDDVIFLFKKP